MKKNSKIIVDAGFFILDWPAVVHILKEKLALLDNPDLSTIIPDHKSAESFKTSLADVEQELESAKICFSKLMELIEVTERSALEMASLSLSDKQLADAKGILMFSLKLGSKFRGSFTIVKFTVGTWGKIHQG